VLKLPVLQLLELTEVELVVAELSVDGELEVD
jgi:hypothetical protein